MLTDDGPVYADAQTFTFGAGEIGRSHNLAPFWQNHACWGLESRNGENSLGALHPVYPQTLLHKGPFLTTTPIFARPVLFYVPFKDSPIEDIATLCYIHPETQVESNVTTTRSHSRRQIEDDVLPRLKINLVKQCERDGVVEGEVQLLDASGRLRETDETIYLECDAGYLNKTRLTLSSGRASFAYRALLLAKDDVATIRAGFQFFSGKTKHALQIV